MTDSILIIGSDATSRSSLARILTEAGFAVGDVPDYHKALLRLDEFSPDIAIVDEVLPSGDGIDACYRLRKSLGIPIILLGRQSDGEMWKRAVEAGADFYLNKPFSSKVLVARIKAILRRYRQSASRSGNEW
jgi:DNA-binding response OmpR family regulator